MKRIVIALNVLILILSSCAREVVEPAQQITGRYALDDGTGLTDEYLEFDHGIISDWHSVSSYPLAENQIWCCSGRKFLLYGMAEYSIQDGRLFCDFLSGRIERNGDYLTLDGQRYMRLDGLREEPYSVINPEKTQYEIPLQEEEYSLPVTVENPIPAGELTASSSDNWITGLTVKDGMVLYHVSATKTPREGGITLKYTHATDVHISIKQSPSTFIRLEETSKIISYAAATVEIPYTIENPVDGSELTVTSNANWCQNVRITHDKVVIDVPENNSGGLRTSYIFFSYVGAENVAFTLTQGYAAASIVLSPSFAQFDYADGTGSFTFEIQNPREGATVTATSQVDWITDVLIGGSTVSFKIAENNSWAQRIGSIEIKYGDIASNVFNITQNGNPELIPDGAVDLGFSVLWASCNLCEDGLCANPEDYGDYYAWGETEPYYSSQYPLTWKDGKTGYNWSSYSLCGGSSSTLKRYNNSSSYGAVDNKTTFSDYDYEDDAARAKLGGRWRIPTYKEWEELRTQCTWTWTTYNGVNGRLVTAPNGNSIFLPAAGGRSGTSLNNVGSYGYYWSSSLTKGLPYRAWYVDFYSSNVYWGDFCSRFYGFSVRPVSD